MKNKKILLKIIIIIMLILNILALTGCNNNKENSKNNEGQNISEDQIQNNKDDNMVKFSYITSEQANTVAIDTEGNVWQMHNSKEFKKVDINAKIENIDVGAHYAVALDTEGNVWTWGQNGSGQLGDGTTTDNNIPQKVFENASMISTGRDSVLVITKNNELYSWGQGWSHKLPKTDYDNTENYLVPTKYESDIKFVYAECGKNNGSMVIDIEGNRYVWGAYTFQMGVEPYQIGKETTVIPYYPLKVLEDTIKFKNVYFYGNGSFVIDNDGNLYGAGGKDLELGFSHNENSVDKYTKIAEGTKFKAICPNSKYSIALDVNGNIWAWGEKNDITSKESKEAFQLTNDRKYKAIAFNNFIEKLAYAIDEDGNLYEWGESKGNTPSIVKINK